MLARSRFCATLARGAGQRSAGELGWARTPSTAATGLKGAANEAARHVSGPACAAGSAAAAAAAAAAATGGAAAVSAEGAATLLQLELAQARRLAWPAGAAAGLVGSVAGAGGATVIVPIVSRFCKSIPQRILAGTSVAAVLATASASTATFAAAGCIDAPASLLLTVPAVALAPLGVRWTSRLDCAALKRLLGCFLLAAAPLIPIKAYLLSSHSTGAGTGAGQEQPQAAAPAGDSDAAAGVAAAAGAGAGVAAGSAAGSTPTTAAGQLQLPPQHAAAAEPSESSSSSVGSSGEGWAAELWQRMPSGPSAAVLLATGGLAGFASGLLGVAPGIIIIPAVALVMPYAQATVLGTSLLAVIPPSAVALLQHHRLGNVDWRMAGALAVSSLVGAAAGSQGAVHAPPGVLEGIFTGALLVLARVTLKAVR